MRIHVGTQVNKLKRTIMWEPAARVVWIASVIVYITVFVLALSGYGVAKHSAVYPRHERSHVLAREHGGETVWSGKRIFAPTTALLASAGELGKAHRSKFLRLVAGIKVTSPRTVSDSAARRMASEVMEITNYPRYRWLAPVDLLGLAAAESDLRVGLVAEDGKRDPEGWDCGLTQVRVTTYYGKTRKARKLCDRLRKSSLLAFQWAAKELTHYRERYCRKWIGVGKPFKAERCIYNTYNQGPKYLREESCGSARCWRVSRYWLRVRCFRTGIELGRRPRKSCRRTVSLRWIHKVYKVRTK